MSKGFSLLELIIVLALIALMTAMVVPRLHDNQSLKLKAETREVIAMLKHARRLAMLRGQEIEVPMVLQKNPENPAKKTKTLLFFPTGGAQGTDLFHCRPPVSVLIAVDNITGKVSPEFNYENPHCQRPQADPDFANYLFIQTQQSKRQYQAKIQHLTQSPEPIKTKRP